MMEQAPEDNIGQGGDSAVIPTVSLGATLREARERLGLSLEDVASQIKFAPQQIEALENDDFRQLSERAFVRGFVRNYARVLHLDAQPLLESLPKPELNSLHLLQNSVEMPFPDARLPQRQNLVWLGAALLLAVLVVVFAVWHYTTPVVEPRVAQVETPIALPAEMKIIAVSSVPEAEGIAPSVPATLPLQPAVVQSPVQAATQPAPQVQPAKPVAQTTVPPQNAAVRLAFDNESWVEIRDKDGNILSSQVNARGSELRLEGNAPLSLAIGRAMSVHLYHRGKPVDLKPHINPSSEVAHLTLE
jgi:cytoskeleton protein RodZ